MTLTEQYGFSYLGSINSSSKIMKGRKYGIDTYVLYLAPAMISGHNVCSMSTPECRLGCLNTSGRAKMPTSYKIFKKARINKTRLFFSDRQAFMSLLVKEITMYRNRAKRKGRAFAVRINGTSDLSLEIFKFEGKNILELFPDVQFYDYSKIPNRVKLVQKYSNYDLTLSYTGYNWDDCENALQSGVRVAVIFDVLRNKALPKTFNGYDVADGDLTDYRPKDKKNVIVGLRWKQIKNRLTNKQIRNSPFVVKPQAKELIKEQELSLAA